jgi:Rne/Rng family ribonuclease
LVYAPFADRCAVSRRIREVAERERLLRDLRALDAGTGGFIARTAAAGATREQLGEEASRLIRAWSDVRDASEKRGTPGLVHGCPELLEHSLRDAPLRELEAVVCDDPADRDRAFGFLSTFAANPPTELRLHTGPVSPFERHAVFAAAARAFRPVVRLPSGGRLVIEQTEAMISVDVDSGRDLAGGSAEQTALRVNLEAVRELPRQLRLRNLAGSIVVDLIRSTEEASRRRVVEAVEQAAVKDRGRLRVAALSESGLLQLTRRRVGPSLDESLGARCNRCGAPGRIKNAIFVAAELIEDLRRRARGHEGAGAFRVRAHPSVLDELQRTATAVELWPGAGPSRPSYESSGIDEPPDRFGILRSS